jgi:hypothetical protein
LGIDQKFNRLISKDIDRLWALGKSLHRREWVFAGGVKSRQKNAGLKVATLISTPNPVSQVLW